MLQSGERSLLILMFALALIMKLLKIFPIAITSIQIFRRWSFQQKLLTFHRKSVVFWHSSREGGCGCRLRVYGRTQPDSRYRAVAVDRTFQGRGTGREIMKALLERGQDAQGIRLLQESYQEYWVKTLGGLFIILQIGYCSTLK